MSRILENIVITWQEVLTRMQSCVQNARKATCRRPVFSPAGQLSGFADDVLFFWV